MLVLFCMLAMAYFGYKLAHFVDETIQVENRQLTTSMENLKNENNELVTEKNQLLVQLEMANMGKQVAREEQALLQSSIVELEEKIAFYERVVAPEVTQDGFLVDGVSVAETASDGYWQLQLVLLQQRQNKAIVRGNLSVVLSGALNGKPHEFQLVQDVLESGSLTYRFKYFQRLDLLFSLPEGFVPEDVSFATQVYQYNRLRGTYSNTLLWNDLLTSADETR